MIRRFVRRNSRNLFLLIILVVLITLALYNDMINEGTMKNIKHIDILTINSIFIGFLFTTLGVIVGFLGNTKIANSDRAGYMDEYYNTIYFGLVFFIVSAVSGLAAIFLDNMYDNQYVLIIEQVAIIMGVAFFIKAIFNLASIIKKVRKNL
ncbi:hypothetical protein [Oceanobacillus profundus]|uniref:Uncharacterized protein n=1 Tax=Oceanobacillus profundus TaxID=372463 RepID=A0A417YA91_9BACI|nr:hypothetical protein [Oceanobacillus profundus]RHW29444.1 hypothetical protein D1B32_21925 [Oceanobacillus profundus]